MPLNLELSLRGAGWANLHISDGATTRTIPSISYLTNALDDLLRMGIDIATDKHWSAAQFDHEPASTVLVAETAWWSGDEWETGARLSSFQSYDLPAEAVTWQMIRDCPRDFVIRAASRDELARAFLAAGERVLELHGEEGYREQWGGSLAFPVRALKALSTALGVPANPPNNYGTPP